MVSNALTALDKIGGFINKFTGSQYDYTEPTGEINENYKQIGEIFGIPIFVDNGAQYSQEFLDFPSLGDVLQTTANTGIDFSTNVTECSACLTITFTIPLIEYPPVTICLVNPKCEEEKEQEDERECISREEWTQLIADEETDSTRFKPICPNPDPDLPFDTDEAPPSDPEGYFFRYSYRYNGQLYWTPWYFRQQGQLLFGNSNAPAPYAPESSYYNVDVNMGGLPFPTACVYGFAVTGATYNMFGWHTRYFYYLCVDREGETFTSGGVESYEGIINFDFRGIQTDPDKTKPIKSVPIPDPVIPMDKCCDDLKKILARIEKQVKEVHKVLNPEQFFKKEVQVPENWIYPGNSKKPVILEDYQDLISAVARLVDRRIGFLPQLVRIKDVDPLKEGDQEVNLVIESIADASRLTVEYLLQANGDLGAIQMMNIKNLYEAGIVHQIAIVIREELEAISAYLGFSDGKKKEEFKMAFNPKIQVNQRNPQSLDKVLPELLKNTYQEVEVSTFNGRKTLQMILYDIKKDTSNAASSVTRKLSDMSLDDLVEDTQTLERIKRLLLVREFAERQGVNDLPEFLKDAEDAYPSSEQTPSERSRPYGFQPSDKPKMQVKTKNSRKNKYKQNPPTQQQGQ